MPRTTSRRSGGEFFDARTDVVPGRHRAGETPMPRGRSSGSGRTRWAAGVVATAVVAGTVGALTTSASAAITGFGPIDPANNFPAYFTDGNGLSLAMCQDGGALCLTGPEQIQDIHAGGGDAEAFYYVADAATDTFVLHNALEAAYAGDGADQEIVFMRTQVTARDGGLVAGETYRVTDPYGQFTCVAEAGGVITQNGCRIETQPVAGEFNRAFGGRIGPFLTRDPAAAPPPAGYLGDLNTTTKVIGSPTGFNAFRVVGPGLTGTCTDGGVTVDNCEQTDQFTLLGKIQPGGPAAALSGGALDFGDIPGAPPVTKTVTYANLGAEPITKSAVSVSGTGAAAYAVQDGCGATVAVGTRCTIDVTFTPQAGTTSTATLSFTDNTPAATRTVALKGSNLPRMYVADPAPPAGLAFPATAVGATSPEDNVVIGNSGVGPLTVASATLTGASAVHYRLGTNNTCTGAGVTVAPDSGCEIGVRFAPTTTGSKTANLRVTDSNGVIVNIPLNGSAAADTVAPTVTGQSPAAGATGVAVGSNVTATFSEAVQGVSGTTMFLRAAGSTTNIAATVTYDSATRVATLDPTADLASGRQYTATLDGGAAAIRDAAGNALADRSWSFTTAAANTAPTVTARAPAVNATSVGVAANITATFSEAVLGVSTSSFAIRPAATPTSTPIAGAVTQNGTTNQWILNPTANLAPDTRYTVTLTGSASAIRDAQGAALTSTSWSFTTGPAPTLTARSPAVNATAVSRTANVTATFSEAVQAVSGATTPPPTFTLRNPAGTLIAAVVTYNATTRVATLNPSVTLAANTVYRVNLVGGANGIKDIAGNPLANVTWTFTTGAA